MNSEEQRLQQQRKAARKTAVVLALVAVGFFAWAVYKVATHAA
ncbi:hypothetical protein [Marinicella meishanensis]|nr:hypothetical protein [Marinicella sp. NBU2979]